MRFMVAPGNDTKIAKWVSTRMPRPTRLSDWEPFSCLGVWDLHKKRLAAGLVYHRFRNFDVEVSCAAEDSRWATKRVLSAIFSYPFNQLATDRLTLTIGSDNPRAIKFCTGIGFTIEGRVRKAYDGENDLIILGMMRSECRWIGEDFQPIHEQQKGLKYG